MSRKRTSQEKAFRRANLRYELGFWAGMFLLFVAPWIGAAADLGGWFIR
ncbi:MAG: hypothetical protein E7L06_08250 [Schaalia turicensis]|nr:hypothetical protein [Schaalia turicensis]